MRNLFCLLAVACALVECTACGLRRPFDRAPGTVAQQQRDAAEHDPYADQDAGPEVVGARPREFAKPRSEPVRSRPYDSNGARGWFSSWFGG